MRHDSLKIFLVDLALQAGKIQMKFYNKAHQISRKPNEGIVTEADLATERYIIKKILRNFPKSSIITEETGEYAGDNSLTWIIDPIDGTSNYAHGFPFFCVSIGVYEGDEARAGVVYNPCLKEFFVAERGKGTFLNNKRVRVSSTKKIKDSLIGTGFYYSQGKRIGKELSIFGRFNKAALAVRRPGSAALDLAYVACGRYDGFWERGLRCWDMAAGFLLVAEAGGRISNYAGKPTTLFNSEVLASNGQIHRGMIRLIRG